MPAIFPFLVLAQADPTADEIGSPIALLLLLVLAIIFLAVAFIAAAAATGVIMAIVGMLAVVCLIAASLLAAGFFFNLALATVIWTRRPRTRAWMGRAWWGVLTLLFGPVAALPFWWLHYVRRAVPRCFQCGFDLGWLPPAHACVAVTPCPECGTCRH